MAFHVWTRIDNTIHVNIKINVALIPKANVAWYTPSQPPSYIQ